MTLSWCRYDFQTAPFAIIWTQPIKSISWRTWNIRYRICLIRIIWRKISVTSTVQMNQWVGVEGKGNIWLKLFIKQSFSASLFRERLPPKWVSIAIIRSQWTNQNGFTNRKGWTHCWRSKFICSNLQRSAMKKRMTKYINSERETSIPLSARLLFPLNYYSYLLMFSFVFCVTEFMRNFRMRCVV